MADCSSQAPLNSDTLNTQHNVLYAAYSPVLLLQQSPHVERNPKNLAGANGNLGCIGDRVEDAHLAEGNRGLSDRFWR